MEIIFDHERLRHYIAEAGIALPAFAKKLAMSVGELERVVAGGSRCSVGLYARMCLLLQVSYDYFLKEDEAEA